MSTGAIRHLSATQIADVVLLLSAPVTDGNSEAVSDTVNNLVPPYLQGRLMRLENIDVDNEAAAIGALYRAVQRLGYHDVESVASLLVEDSFSVPVHNVRGRIYAIRK